MFEKGASRMEFVFKKNNQFIYLFTTILEGRVG